MVDRIQLLVPIYMKADGQPRLVEAGSVLDVPVAGAFSFLHVTVLPESPGSLASHGGPTPVRNFRSR